MSPPVETEHDADYNRWAKRELWTTEEAGWLLAGLEPDDSTETPDSVFELQQILEDALVAGALQNYNRFEVAAGLGMHEKLKPREVFEYALHRGLDLPDGLLDVQGELSPRYVRDATPPDDYDTDPFKRFPQADGETITAPELMKRWKVPKRQLERLAIEKQLNAYMNGHQIAIRRDNWKGQTFQYPPAEVDSEKESHWQTGAKTVFTYTPEGSGELPDEAYYQLPEVLMYEVNHADTLSCIDNKTSITPDQNYTEEDTPSDASDGLYRTLGLLAKVYSTTDKRLQHKDGAPNVNAIVQQLLDEVEILKEDDADINTHGAGKSNAHDFITKGIKLLSK